MQRPAGTFIKRFGISALLDRSLNPPVWPLRTAANNGLSHSISGGVKRVHFLWVRTNIAAKSNPSLHLIALALHVRNCLAIVAAVAPRLAPPFHNPDNALAGRAQTI